MQVTNDNFAIFDRTGPAPVLISTGKTEALVAPNGEGAVDPQIIWDEDTSRFYFAAIANPPDNVPPPSHPWLTWGFSQNASPNSAADWCRYVIDYTPSGLDFPRLGDTADFIVISHNTLDANQGWHVRWITKPATDAGADGSCPPHPRSDEVNHPQTWGNFGEFPSVSTPANQIDSSSAGYLVQALPIANVADPSITYDQLTLIRITRAPNGEARFGTPHRVQVPSYRGPQNAPQAGTDFRLDTLNGAISQAVLAVDPRFGRPVVWTQHAVQGGAGSEVRWYEIDPAGGPSGNMPQLLQAGRVSDPVKYYFNAAISPDRSADAPATGRGMIMGFNSSSENTFAAIEMVGKLGGRPQSAPVTVHVSTAPAQGVPGGQLGGCNLTSRVCRWGDYPGATPDPTISGTAQVGRVWLTNQWQESISSGGFAGWQTWNWVARLSD